jgi:hypothetical protein
MNAHEIKLQIARSLEAQLQLAKPDAAVVRELLAALAGEVEEPASTGDDPALLMYGFDVDGMSGVLRYGPTDAGESSLGPIGNTVNMRARTSRCVRVQSFRVTRSMGLALAPVSVRVGDYELLGNVGAVGLPMRAVLGAIHGVCLRPSIDIVLTCRVQRPANLEDIRLGMLCVMLDSDTGEPLTRVHQGEPFMPYRRFR